MTPQHDERDRDWEDDAAAAAWVRERQRKRGDLEDLERQRSRLSLPRRLEAAVRRIPRDGVPATRLSHTPGRRSAGDVEHPGPPRPDGREREAHERLALIWHHVRMLERIGDEEQGLREPLSDGRLLTTAERDRMVWEDFAGVRAENVALEAPYLGTSARTIERARVAEARRRGVKVRPIDGVVLGEREEQAA